MVKKRANPSKSAFYSMTGYGKSSGDTSAYIVEVEVRSLNNRFLDLNLKLPKVYSELEMELRDKIAGHLKRGRIDVTVTRIQKAQHIVKPFFNKVTFDKFYSVYCAQAKKISVLNDDFKQRALLTILQRRDVLDVECEDLKSDLKTESKLLFQVADRAISALLKMRQNEGARLAADIKKRCAVLSNLAATMGSLADSYAAKSRERLKIRMKKLLDENAVDDGRLEAEVVMLVDRSDITEELVRVDSHLEEVRNVLVSSSNGKKLEFLVQELGREFNTIGSKSGDVEISAAVVNAKSELERIREQVQNLE